MKTARTTFLVGLIASTFFSCANKNEKDVPVDFWFTIQDETEAFNSKTSHFTRKYTTGDSTIQVKIGADLKEVYSLFAQYDFLSFPVEFACKGYEMIPSFTSTISIHYQGRIRRSSHTFGCFDPVDQRLRAEKFEELERRLWNIVRNQKAVKSMRKSDMIFL